MKRFHRLLATALALVLVCGLVPASAASFPDIVSTGFGWAQADINFVTEKGLYNGYSDGTFRPGEMITLEQAIAVCVRACFSHYSAAVRAEISERYKAELDSVFGTDRAWFREDFAVAVEAGLVSVEELEGFYTSGALSKGLTRQEFTEYLAKAMQFLPPPLDFKLTFTDNDSINTRYAQYVYLLSSIGIIVGDMERNFNPDSYIRRADSAVMFARAVRYMDENGMRPELEGYTDYSAVAGTITDAATNADGSVTLTLSGTRGDSADVLVPANAKVYEHNIYTSRTAMEAGRYARALIGTDGKVFAVRLYDAPSRYEGNITVLSVWGIEIDTGTAKRYFDIDDNTRLVPLAVRLDGTTGEWVGGTTDQEALTVGYDRAECVVDAAGNLTAVYLMGGKRTETALFGKLESGVMTVLTFDGVDHELKMGTGIGVTADGKAATNLSAYSGRLVTLVVDNYTDNIVAADIDTKTEYVQGGLVRVATYTNSPSAFFIVNPATGRESSYSVMSGVKAYFNGEQVALSALPSGSFITLRLDGGKVAEAFATVGVKTVSGELSAIHYGTIITLDIVTEDGEAVSVKLDTKSLPPVTRAGKTSSVDKFTARDTITVTYKYNRITGIEAAAPTADFEATVRSIAIDAGGSQITLEMADGSSRTMTVAAGASIRRDGASVALSSLAPGTKVAVIASGTSVTALEVLTVSATAGELSGTVLFINLTDRTILLGTDEGNITINYPISAKLMNTKGESLSYTALEIGNTVQIHGEYGADGQFSATLIIKK